MSARTPPPKIKDIAILANVTRESVGNHFNNKTNCLPAMVSAHKLCNECADSNLSDIMTVIHKGIDSTLINSIGDIHAPVKDNQHKEAVTSFLNFLFEAQEAGRAVSFVKFSTSDRFGWHMECTIDGLAWKVESYNADTCKMWLGLMPFLGLHKKLAGVLSAMYNGLNE